MGKPNIDENAKHAIEEIIWRGKDAKVKVKGDSVVVSELKETIKYSTQ